MRIGLTFLSQKTVLRYMEANQRIMVSFYCPSIGKFERPIPLNLKSFSVGYSGIKLNGAWYGYRNFLKLLYYLFRGRVKVFAQKFSVFMEKPLPSYLNGRLYVEHLEVGSRLFQNWLPLLNASSYPLKKLSVLIDPVDNYPYHELTQHLVIRCDPQVEETHDRITRILQEQTIKIVEIENLPRFESLLRDTLRRWMLDGREIGTQVTFLTERRGWEITDMLDNLKRDFEGKAVHFKDENGKRRLGLLRTTTYRCSNDVLEVVVYFRRHEDKFYKICMEMIKIGETHDGHFTASDSIPYVLEFFGMFSFVVLAIWKIVILLKVV